MKVLLLIAAVAVSIYFLRKHLKKANVEKAESPAEKEIPQLKEKEKVEEIIKSSPIVAVKKVSKKAPKKEGAKKPAVKKAKQEKVKLDKAKKGKK